MTAFFLCELWLTKAEEHLLNKYQAKFKTLFQPASKKSTGRPFGGSLLLLRKRTFWDTNILLQDNNITSVVTKIYDSPVIITGVYLQPLSSKSDCFDNYKSQLSSISGLINQLSESHDSITLGDFQSCPSAPNSRRTSKLNPFSKFLTAFLAENHLTPVDITNDEGPTYTYHHLSLPNRSYIDHILVSQNLLSLFNKTEVLEPNPLNTSDHLPVATSMIKPQQAKNTSNENREFTTGFIPNYMWKNEQFNSIYNENVLQSFKHNFKPSMISENDIQNLQSLLKDCASEAYAQLKSDFHQIPAKPWWNQDISKSRKILQQMFNIWRDNDFPRSDDISYHRYLFARKKFRSLVKSAKNQATVQHYINIDKLKKTNPKSYWKHMKIAKRSTRKLFTINKKTTNEDITSEFQEHFNHILNTPRTLNTDNNLTNELLKILLQDLEETNTEGFYISEVEVENAILSLSKDKSRDPFQLKSEHFSNAINDSFTPCLTKIINNIVTAKDLPPSLSTSLIIPRIKSHKKSLNDPNNYRGISLIPIITKIIERIIITKCPQLKNHKPSQFGFVSGSSTIHPELLIRDTISYYNTKGSPVFICSLDAEKAFDSCNWFKLFTKLSSNSTFPTPILKFLIKLYLQGEATITYNNCISDSFNFSQGVRQGSLLSPYLYKQYREDLLDQIRELKVGTLLPGNIDTSVIAYADDLILLSSTLKGLQLILDKCVEYGIDHALKFNHLKTQFVVSGKCHVSDPQLILYGNQVLPQDNLHHLGFKWKVKLSSLQLNEHAETRLKELWAVTTSLITAGVRKLHPNSIVTLFKSIVIPKMIYGLELVDLSSTQYNRIDRQARASLKSLIGVSKHSKNLLHVIYNIPNISSLLSIRRVNLIRQLIQNDTTRHYMQRTEEKRSFSKLNDFIKSCQYHDIDIVSLCLGQRQHLTTETHSTSYEEDQLDSCIFYLQNWHCCKFRKQLYTLLESSIHTGI